MYTILNKLKPAKHLILSILCVLPAFLLLYPKTFITIDEHDYLYNAQLLVSSGLKTDCSLNIPGQWPTNLGYCISKYNVGTSFFLIPSALINKDLAAFTTLLVFIFSIIIFYKILINYNLDKRFIYLFALFPPFVFFSRTIMSEMYSMFTLLAIFYCFTNLNRSVVYKILVGLFATLSIYIRYTNLIPLLIIGVYFLYEYSKNSNIKYVLKKYWVVHLSFLVGLLTLFAFNYNYYGQILRSGYYFSSEEGAFALKQIPIIFIKYFILLNIFYPLSLIAVFKSRIKRKILFLVAFLSLLFFYTIFRNESFPGKASDLILGLRFLIPVYPFLLLPYFEILDRLKNHKYSRIILYTSIAVLFVIDILINYIHYKFILK